MGELKCRTFTKGGDAGGRGRTEKQVWKKMGNVGDTNEAIKRWGKSRNGRNQRKRINQCRKDWEYVEEDKRSRKISRKDGESRERTDKEEK